MTLSVLRMSILALTTIVFASPALANGDAAKGEKLFKKRCTACHTIEADGKNKIGPNLFGVFESKPGQKDSYRYSDSYAEAADKGVTWTKDNLEHYLSDPKGFLTKVTGDAKARSKMTFKLRKESEQEDVIAYLKTMK